MCIRDRVRERPGGYYLASRKFELAELKLLVDAVQASKFITTKKSRELIAKLETLCGREQAKQLHRQVVVCLLYTSRGWCNNTFNVKNSAVRAEIVDCTVTELRKPWSVCIVLTEFWHGTDLTELLPEPVSGLNV